MTGNNRVNWNRIPNRQSIQKKALKKAIEYAGGSNNLARLLGCSKSTVSTWIHLTLKSRDKNLMGTLLADRIENITKIKGIQYDLCPELKK